MAADTSTAPTAFRRPVGLPQAVAVAIRDTVDGGVIPNVSWAVVEALTHTWTSKQLGTGGFGDVFKGENTRGTVMFRVSYVAVSYCCNPHPTCPACAALALRQARLWTNSLTERCTWLSKL
jgi:hypothetical protein